ncbi:MAG: cardiolipin synthase [Planctomycetota bacterium]|nr:MAG: cardiolipin synthase [Planctomycetota bacterium]
MDWTSWNSIGWEIILSHLFTILGFLFALFLFSRIFAEKYSPQSTLAWIIAIIFAPYIGVPAYLIFGGRKVRKARRIKQELYPAPTKKDEKEKLLGGNVEKILIACEIPPARADNQIKMLPTGEMAYNYLVDLIENAQESIHILTFILAKDEVAKDIVERLTRKAREGIEVRLLLDSLGSFRSLGRFLDPLREAGGKVGEFLPVLPLRRKWHANLRNHRKIVIVDHTKGMVGGMNIGSEYMGPTPQPDRWADFAMAVEGAAVCELEKIFVSDWEFATDEHISLPETSCFSWENKSVIQVVPSGPDVPTEPLYDSILAALFEASERVWIVTPYYVPDESLQRVLCLLARLGVDVRLIVPLDPDHLFLESARRPYFRELQRAGGKIYCYTPTLIHAKITIIDNDIGIIGSANMDIRSLYLNFEVSLFLYTAQDVETLSEIVASTYLPRCIPWESPTINFIKRWQEHLARLLAPLL